MTTTTITLKNAGGTQVGQQTLDESGSSLSATTGWPVALFLADQDSFAAFWTDYVLCVES